MKQHTTPEQTAKLIELGFEKPTMKNIPTPEGEINEEWYSIGELIEILLSNSHHKISIYNVGLRQHKVLFKKLINRKFKVLFSEVGYEPIDLLFNCIVKLKEEGVI